MIDYLIQKIKLTNFMKIYFAYLRTIHQQKINDYLTLHYFEVIKFFSSL